MSWIKRYFESARFGSGEFWFKSGQPIFVTICYHAKISNFVKNFRFGTVQLGSSRISSALSSEPILHAELDIDSSHPTRILDSD